MKLSALDMRLFAAVADHGGITAAARVLGLSKSVVSRDLAALEKQLGTRLLHRTTRRVALTETGTLLATYARRAVEEMENAAAAIEATRDVPRGELRITAPFAFVRFVLAPRLVELRVRYPEIRLSIDPSVRVVDLVEEGLDLAIRTGELPASSLVARRLASVPAILVAAPSYIERRSAPRTPRDLARHDLLDLNRDLGASTWTLTGAGRRPQAVPVSPILAMHEPGLLLDIAETGVGIAPLPEIYARAALATGSLVRVLSGYQRGVTPIHAMYPSRRILAPKVRVFVDFVAEIMAPAKRISP